MWPCWKKSVTGGGLWEFKDSHPLPSAYGLRCELSTCCSTITLSLWTLTLWNHSPDNHSVVSLVMVPYHNNGKVTNVLGFTVSPKPAWNLLWRIGWSWSNKDLSASTSQMLRLKQMLPSMLGCRHCHCHLLLIFITCVCVCVCTNTRVCNTHMCGGQKTVFRGVFSSFTCVFQGWNSSCQS